MQRKIETDNEQLSAVRSRLLLSNQILHDSVTLLQDHMRDTFSMYEVQASDYKKILDENSDDYFYALRINAFEMLRSCDILYSQRLDQYYVKAITRYFLVSNDFFNQCFSYISEMLLTIYNIQTHFEI